MHRQASRRQRAPGSAWRARTSADGRRARVGSFSRGTVARVRVRARGLTTKRGLRRVHQQGHALRRHACCDLELEVVELESCPLDRGLGERVALARDGGIAGEERQACAGVPTKLATGDVALDWPEELDIDTVW